MSPKQSPAPLQSALLNNTDTALHGFFTRAGGVSDGIYRGLNVGLGSDDLQSSVKENRARVAGWFGATQEKLATVHQIHSPDVVIVDEKYGGERPKADAMVTNVSGVVIGILTADCGPILFLDPENQVAGAAHAGWKGALTGVLENTIAAMETLGAKRENIRAVLGPSISAANYEVGPEFVERFTAHDPDYDRFFSPSIKAGHAMFDLPALTIKRLRDAGIVAEKTGHCTYADEDRFFSYRRTTHRKEPDYGRQVSAIMLRDN